MHTNRRREWWRGVVGVVCLTVALAPATALAKTTTWTNASLATDLWSDPGNWDNGIPSFFDVVYFGPVGGTSQQDIPGLGLDTMDMSGYTGVLTLMQPLDVAGDLTTSGMVDATAATVNVGGSLSVGGDLLVIIGSLYVGIDLTIGGGLVADGATVVVDGSVDVPAGALDMGSGSIDIGGDLTVSPAGSTFWTPGGTLRFTGSGTQTWSDSSPVSDYGDVEVDPVPGSQVVVPSFLPQLTIDGELSVNAGTLEVGPGFHVAGAVMVAPGATIAVPATAIDPTFFFESFFDVSGTFSAESAGGTLQFGPGALNAVTVGPGATFDVIGAPGNLIHLEQDGVAGGPQWLFDVDPAATVNIQHVRVQDSDATAGNTVKATRSEDGGNNDNWNFGGAHTIFGNLGATDNWSDAANWSNGVPLTGDTVSFDPIGGLSVMDLAGLTLATMDMTGFTGTLDQTLPLSIDGFVVTSGTFALSGNSLTVGGSLHVGAGTVDADGGGVLEVHGPITGDPGASLNMGSGMLAVYDDVDLSNFSPVTWDLGGSIEGRAFADYQIDLGATIELSDVFVKHSSAAVRLTIGNAADSIAVNTLHVDAGILLTSADITCDLETDLKVNGSISGTYDNGRIDITGGITLASPKWVYKKGSLKVTLNTGTVDGQLEVRGDSVGVWFGAGDTLRVNPGGTFNVISDIDIPAALRLNGTVHSDRWYLDIRPGSSTQFQNVRVQDSDASTGETAVATGTSVDDGNNLNWDFQVTAADDTPPARLAVHAFPNPFNPGTTIRYSVPQTGPVSVRIYDVAGRLVRTLVAEVRSAGEWTIGWDGRDGTRGRAGSGVYFCRVESGGESVVHKLVLLR